MAKEARDGAEVKEKFLRGRERFEGFSHEITRGEEAGVNALS